MSAEVMLLLISEPASAERLSDLLAEIGLTEGWYETDADLVGGSAPYRNQREKVSGRRPKRRFELFVSRDTAARITAELDLRLGSGDGSVPPMRWLMPLTME